MRPRQEKKLRSEAEDTVRVRKAPMDLPFLLLVLLLLSVGVIMVLSASFASAYFDLGRVTGGNPTFYFLNQAVFAISGVLLMLVVSRFPTSFYRRIALPSMLLALGLLLLVPVIGVRGGGAQRWISLGFTTFQPSEVAKPAVVLLFAHMACLYKDKMKTFRWGVLPFVLILLPLAGLLLIQPHLSATVIILAVGAAMMFLGGTQIGWFIGGFGALAVAGTVVVSQFGHASARIVAWRNPFDDLLGAGWQIVQSLYAIGSGGALGLGLGQSRQKYLYLPEEHNDYIFAIVAEELGFLGVILILSLFALLVIRGFWIALHARTKFATLIAAGMSSMLALQVFLNVGVVTNLLPSTGISLPFFSYGGTALWFQLLCMGVILSVSREIPAKKAG